MLKDFANVAVEQKLRRVVFAVPSVGDVDAVLFEEEVKILENAGVDFTILKYATPFQNCDEAKLPFRIVPGTSEIPKANAQNNFGKLASGDLFRVISELLDLKKSFGKVYGIGPGNVLDTEILVYMKAQGFSEHEQVRTLLSYSSCNRLNIICLRVV